MTVEDVGSRGGLKTSEKHGELFSGKLGGKAAKEDERGTWLL